MTYDATEIASLRQSLIEAEAHASALELELAKASDDLRTALDITQTLYSAAANTLVQMDGLAPFQAPRDFPQIERAVHVIREAMLKAKPILFRHKDGEAEEQRSANDA